MRFHIDMAIDYKPCPDCDGRGYQDRYVFSTFAGEYQAGELVKDGIKDCIECGSQGEVPLDLDFED
jgi:hypothetical protein